MTRARDLAKGTFSGDLTVDTNTLVVDSSNNNVGIGTSSPSALLHVEAADGAAGGAIKYTSTGVASGYMSADGAGLCLATDTAGITFRTGVTGNDPTDTGTERMRIDSAGNVGIGVSTPSNNHANANNLVVGNGTAGGIANYVGTGLGWYAFSRDNANNSDAYDGGISYDGSRNLMFHTNAGTERMRIDSNGSILFNTTTLSDGSNNSMSYSNTGDETLIISSAGTGASFMIQFLNGNGTAGQIISGGTTTSYETNSDYRLKTDVQPMTGASDRVLALKPVNFEWIVDGTRTDGFLAHEAQEIVPEAISGSKDAMKDKEYEVSPAVLDDDGNVVTEAVMGTRSVPALQGIDQSKLVPLLTAALQEALNKIDAMETRLAALEAV
jgi:hypothetical protein